MPEMAVSCEDMELAAGGTVVVTLEVGCWHLGGCELTKDSIKKKKSLSITSFTNPY